MKNYQNYKKHVQVDMVKYSGTFHFNEQLKQEGTDIKINGKSSQVLDDIETTIRAIVRNHGNEFNESKEERSIMIDKKYEFKAGDYVEYLGDIYLTNNSIDKDNPFFNTAKMTRCNYVLKWMDEGVLKEQSCIVYNNTKNTGGTKTLTSGLTEIDAMVNINIQNNEDTRKINYGKRLYTMKNAWQVTLIDNITTENTFSWTLGKDSLNSEIDDIVNGICDAFEHSYAISLNSNNQTLVETETYKIVPNVTDKGVTVTNPKVNYTSSDENIAKVDSTGLVTALSVGSCIITCSIGTVNSVLNLNVNEKPISPVVSYSTNWSQGTNIKQFVTSTLSCIKTISGVADSTLHIDYSFDTNAQTLINAGKIVVTRKSDSSISIKNVSVTTSTNIYLTVTDSVNNTKILDNQQITLTGM
ncbi:Ig-like domain-containing protein [Clostridium beijerinckii]|uniref:Ig-like domain-containing protein n=1 Tax=Clostridium beijerinckii TaxID=1520 RepID=UPI0017A88D27|nr:Ig-like domain-containing protein [Clostridium beijerinckii]NRU52561.1 hypothetical protein [Clostridium beijerinckii]NYC69262.1 hypothetical protein [Clostridium beijerinckii]NYC91762.1 hypothetical protein [Clostridium beijerinckii]